MKHPPLCALYSVLYAVTLHHLTVCTTLAVKLSIHITINGTLSQSCLSRACLTFNLQPNTILVIYLYIDMYMSTQSVGSTLYWVDT